MAIALCLALASLASAAAEARLPPGAVLDPSFGDHGILKLPSASAFTAEGTTTRAGDILVSGGPEIQVLDRHGSLGGAFGGSASIDLPAVAGTSFELGAFTVDSQGRLLVVGTSFFPESENPSPRLENGSRAFRPGVVRMIRLLPDGRRDPTFGQDGVVETTLGLSPPMGTDGTPLGSHPAIRAYGVAIGPQGQIVVTGGAIFRLGESCEHDSFVAVGVSAGFVARFTSTGEPDPTFGTDGLVGGRDLSENALGAEGIGEPVVDPRGRITFLSTAAYRCESGVSHLGIAQLTADGHPRAAFGTGGAIVGPYERLAGGRHGAIVGLAEPSRIAKKPLKVQVTKISGDGKPDRLFGNDGHATVRFSPYSRITLSSLAVDPGGRVLMGGSLNGRKASATVLSRVSAGGKWEKPFGPRGRVSTPVRGVDQIGSGELFFDPRGRLVSVYQYADKGHRGLLVARYLLRD